METLSVAAGLLAGFRGMTPAESEKLFEGLKNVSFYLYGECTIPNEAPLSMLYCSIQAAPPIESV